MGNCLLDGRYCAPDLAECRCLVVNPCHSGPLWYEYCWPAEPHPDNRRSTNRHRIEGIETERRYVVSDRCLAEGRLARCRCAEYLAA